MTTETAVPAKKPAADKDPAFQYIMVGLIQESKANPRKTFTAKGIDELAESIRQQGVLEPILIRPVEDKDAPYELVAGARRLRAARKAGLEEIPALVRPLSDVQALEIMVIENLQREDLHPLEEAQGFRTLMKEAGYKVGQIAEKTGKSVSEIYANLKLLDLIEPARKAFIAGKLDEGHAVLIARLHSKDQVDVLKVCHQELDYGNDISPDWDDDRQVEPDKERTISVKELERWIQTFVHLDLAQAPWSQDNEKLLPKAGPCTTCVMRHVDGKKTTCANRFCFADKYLAWIEAARGPAVYAVFDVDERGLERLGLPKKGSMKLLAKGEWVKATPKCNGRGKSLVAYGKDKGKLIDICTNSDTCKAHGKETDEEGSSSSRTRKPTAAEAAANRKAEQANEQRIIKERATVRARVAIFQKIVEGTKAITREDLELLAITAQGFPYLVDYKADYMPPELQTPAAAAKASDKDLAKYLIACCFQHNLSAYGDARNLYATAARHEIDVKAIEKEAVRQVAHERMHHERRMAWKGRVAAQAKTFDELTCTGCGRKANEQAKGGWHWVKKNDKSKAATCNDCEREENERQ